MDERIKKYGALSEDMMKLFKLVSLLSAVLGAFLAMMYCLKIPYFPVGLTVGDTLFFIWLAVVFGFGYIAFIILMAYSLVAPIRIVALLKRILRKHSNEKSIKSWDEILFVLSSLFIGAIIIYFSFLMDNVEAMIQTIILLGILYRVYLDVDKESSVFVKPLILLLIVVSPALFAGISDGLLDRAMMRIGVKINLATVSIDKDISDNLLKELNRNKLLHEVDKKCKKQCVFHNVDIAFTGVGVNTVLSFSDKDNNTYNFPIKNTSLSLSYKR